MGRSLLLGLSCLLAACLSFTPKPPRYEPVILPSGVVVTDLAVPDRGRRARSGDRIALHYELSLGDGTPVDSSYERGAPIELVLGESVLLPGLQEAVVGMRRFGRRKVVVPPEVAYGDEGLPPRIPPRAVLRVLVELMELEPGD